ncbi:uncharacterized protein LOC128957880 [Oppia nitens]|uniref:uncharacterized protein LOC128957880 n=1 Tax=Oppia nitens TaxID=1686743 RepID=UPI0023DBE032|nr:uncharacterized protein LOC128957880 [Oppia nitens]
MFSIKHSIIKFNTIVTNCMKQTIYNNVRQLSSSHDMPDDVFELPPLMRFTPRGMPNVLKTLKNQFFTFWLIRPMIDNDFQMNIFLNGAKQALSTISCNLANDNIDGIQEMLTKEAYDEVKTNLAKYSPQMKERLKVNVEDIIFCFPYDISVERLSSDSAIIKIFVVYDCIVGLQDVVRDMAFNRKDLNLKTFFGFDKYLENKICCNYEFKRHYVKGKDSQWIVNKLLHIKDRDVLKMYVNLE